MRSLQRQHPVTLLLLGLAFLFSTGCETTLRSDLSERQAEDIVLALDGQGIASRKTQVSRVRDGAQRFEVQISRRDLGPAMAILQSLGLPRPPRSGLDSLYEENSLIPSPQAEQARYQQALATEVTQTLEALPYVQRARVHFTIAAIRFRALDAPELPARASVLIQYPGPDTLSADQIAEITTLVAGAVPELHPEAVQVVTSEAASAPTPRTHYVYVGPIAVSPSSAPTLKIALAIALVLNLLLAGGLLWLNARHRRAKRAHRPVSTSEV